MIFFTSDIHFGHRGIIKHCDRPYPNVDEMDYDLIARWNRTIGPKDEVYVLGDVSFHGGKETIEIFKQLNGKKHLIWGNHDKHLRKFAAFWLDLFEDVHEYKKIRVQPVPNGPSQQIVLCHYPFESWDQQHKGSWHLHGHCHGTLPVREESLRMDVGVDCHGYYPISLATIKRVMDKKADIWSAPDGHGRHSQY